MIGKRIQQARAAAGMSQRDCAEAVGVSAMAISKYERGQMQPSSDVLMRIAQALGVGTDYFFRDQTVTLEEVEFRKHSALPKQSEDRVLADVQEQVERWQALEAVIPPTWPLKFKLPPGLPRRVSDESAIEDIVDTVRSLWDLGTGPIRDLVDTLEQLGIRVIQSPIPAAQKFDGLVARANGQMVVVVSSEWPGDRQRFTLAHELGHIVLHGRLAEGQDEEKACNRFAGAFLVPRAEAVRVLGPSRKSLEPQELYLLKHEWGFSMNGWVSRASQLGILNPKNARSHWALFTRKGWRVTEPGAPYPAERPRRYQQLVYRALAEDLIGESKGAELLGLTQVELRQRRRMEATNEADRH